MELDFENPIPLHAQLKTILEDQILEGYYKDKIPSERELMDMYSVSRSTVREAVSILVRGGILEKRHGKGTFVSLKPVQEWLQMINFTETTKSMRIKLLDHGRVLTPENIADANGFEDESYHIKRLRLRGDVPIAIEMHYYSLELGKELTKFNLSTTVLYDALEGNLNINFNEAEQIITCGFPSKEDAEHLGLNEMMCVLITERMIFDSKGNLVEYYKGLFRSDMHSFAMKLNRKNN
ncbi:GntR family transcriptional regulator [Peribacillus simplex]|uniref:GntR family transcriptional regulator n=1 Tax=Peribacillus simplex TaxID=1478 RepID=A0A9X8WN09_9BACI|nr:GntR family transcriptional regulator [Peribacillus simplex]SIS04701.1 GntR family transcriptional regulator [Peribacillus simplex]